MTWRIEGFVDLLTTAMDPSDTVPPFGVDPAIVGDGVVDFSLGIIATFDAPDVEGDNQPDDGAYAVDLQYLLVRIGNTTWDHTMPNTGVQFQIEGGAVTCLGGNITCTVPAHPDLELFMAASPGTWIALDERGADNLGTIEGTYSLRDGVTPEPATLALLGLGAVCLVARRRRK